MGRRKRKRFKQFKKFKFRPNPIVIWSGAFLFMFLALFGSLGYLVYSSDLFRVKLQNINSNVELNPKIEEMIEGKSLFSLDIAEIASLILEKNPEYKDVSILKRFPSDLIIKVKKRIAYIQIKGRKFYPLDKEGVIIADGSTSEFDDLIVAEIGSDWRLFRKGYRISDQALAYVFDLVSNLRKSNMLDSLGISSINATQPEALYFMIEPKKLLIREGNFNKKIKVIIGKSDFSRKISLLENVVKVKFKDKLNLIQYIDLRYKEVYVGLNR